MASPCKDNVEEPCSSTNDIVSAENKEDNNIYDDLLKEYEEMFKNRYTMDDKYYVESINNPIKSPPIVHPWYNRQRRNFDYNQRGRRAGRGRNWSDRGRGHNNRHTYQSNNRYNPY